jgi:hypothetical protein
MALGSTQPLTEMSTRNLQGRPARKAVNLTVIRLSTKCGSLDVSRLNGLLQGQLYQFIFNFTAEHQWAFSEDIPYGDFGFACMLRIAPSNFPIMT